jgi:hypothetical protein
MRDDLKEMRMTPFLPRQRNLLGDFTLSPLQSKRVRMEDFPEGAT